jgi:hypothetical protein
MPLVNDGVWTTNRQNNIVCCGFSGKKKTEIPEVLFLKTTINLGKWQPGQNVSLKVHAIYRWEKNKTFDETLP